jgi:ABA4-like protein
MDRIFAASSLLVFPFWFLMIFLPKWGFTRKVIGSVFIVVPAALLYVGLVLPRIHIILPAVIIPEISEISRLLAMPDGTTLAWVHFLTFDLFVGRWVYVESRERDLSVWLMAPVLFFVLMLGPLGFLLYLAVRGKQS